MDNIDNGGRAFPCGPHYEKVGEASHFYEGSYGMSQRDWFAGHALSIWSGAHFNALAELSQQCGLSRADGVARACYEIADAMLKERVR